MGQVLKCLRHLRDAPASRVHDPVESKSSPSQVLPRYGNTLIARSKARKTGLSYRTHAMDDSIAAKHEPVAVVIRFSKAHLYWLFVRQLFRFPTILWLLLTVALVAFVEYRAGQGFYYSAGILVLMVGVLPGIQIFRMRNSPGVNSDTQHIFADPGISTVMGPLSNFAEWSFAADATEDKQHLTVKFRSGAVVLPKDQVQETELRHIRAIIRSNLREKAKLFSD